MIPFFLTVDTEGDNIWSKPSVITSKNTEQLSRFQTLCENYNIKPIYLTNYEAAINKDYQDFIEKHKDNLEVGLHLHAWNSPPIYKLTEDDYLYQPYLHEYPDEVIVSKIKYMVDLLEKVFKVEIVSHRGGRYSINNVILDTLYKCGIKIDCSVVPGVNWKNSLGNPTSSGGPDFKLSESKIHLLEEGIYEIPVSTYKISKFIDILDDKNLIKRLLSKVFSYKNMILRSKIDNFQELQKIVRWNVDNNTTHLEYIIHSSELVRGRSPLINTKKEEELFYENLELFFIFLKENNIKSYTFREWFNAKEDM